MNGRKSYEVVGYSMDSYFLCVDCHGSEAQCAGGSGPDFEGAREGECGHAPVFLGDCDGSEICDGCLHKWIETGEGRQRGADGVLRPSIGENRAPLWIYLDGDGPAEEDAS